MNTKNFSELTINEMQSTDGGLIATLILGTVAVVAKKKITVSAGAWAAAALLDVGIIIGVAQTVR